MPKKIKWKKLSAAEVASFLKPLHTSMPAKQIQLPPLDVDCLQCTGEVGEKIRRENSKAWREWNAEETEAYDAFVAQRRTANDPQWMDYELWQRSDTYRELKDREPEDLPEVGCGECDWTAKQLTDAGRQVLDFLHRHTTLTDK